MKAILSVLLSGWILLGSFMPRNDMEELAKIPALWNHYQAHKAEAGSSFSFSDFIKEHYSKSTSSHADDTDHHKLPFYEHNCPGLVFLISTFNFSVENQIRTLEPIRHFYRESAFLQPALEYWQPPKSA